MLSAARAFLFDFAIVDFNAVAAELVQAGLHIDWVLVDVEADGAQDDFLYFVEQVQTYKVVL